MVDIVCNCSEIIVKSANGVTKIRSKITLVKDDGQAYAVCKGCGTEVPVPLTLDKSRHPPLILRQ